MCSREAQEIEKHKASYQPLSPPPVSQEEAELQRKILEWDAAERKAKADWEEEKKLAGQKRYA